MKVDEIKAEIIKQKSVGWIFIYLDELALYPPYYSIMITSDDFIKNIDKVLRKNGDVFIKNSSADYIDIIIAHSDLSPDLQIYKKIYGNSKYFDECLKTIFCVS